MIAALASVSFHEGSGSARAGNARNESASAQLKAARDILNLHERERWVRNARSTGRPWRG
jgi:hypothetical protein